MQALKSPCDDVQRQAIWALGQLGAEGAGAIPALVEALAVLEDPDLRYRVIGVLGEFGPLAAGAAPALARALREEETPAGRRRVKTALEKLGPEGKRLLQAAGLDIPPPAGPDGSP